MSRPLLPGTKVIFEWHSDACESLNWPQYKQYDGQICTVVSDPVDTGNNCIIKFPTGLELGVDSHYEIKRLEESVV